MDKQIIQIIKMYLLNIIKFYLHFIIIINFDEVIVSLNHLIDTHFIGSIKVSYFRSFIISIIHPFIYFILPIFVKLEINLE